MRILLILICLAGNALAEPVLHLRALTDLGQWKLKAHGEGVEPGPDRHGKSGSALRFGANSWIELSPSNRLNQLEEFTLSGWIYPTRHREHNSIVSKVTPSRDFNLQLNLEGRLVAHINSGRYEFAYSERKLPLNQWTHVAASFHHRTWKLYMNGKLDSVHKVEQVPLWQGQYLTVGNIFPAGPEGFLGSLDEVRVDSKELTPAQIGKLAKS